METKDIRELIELISRSNFATFEMEREGFRLKLVKEQHAVVGASPVAVGPTTEVVDPAPTTPVPEVPAAIPATGLVDMKSPIVGTFYTSAGPESPPFVEVGSRIKKGQVVCIVEAMKVMNEIESELDAEVVEIAVKNEQPVEFGEVLFRLRPLG